MRSSPPLRPLAVALGVLFTAPIAYAQTPVAKPAVAPTTVKPATPAAATTAKPAPTSPATATTTAPATPTTASPPPADPAAAPLTPPPPPLSDVILTNGDIITLDDKRPSAQAIAIKGTKIIAVGKSKDILARWKSEGTEVVDLAGKTVVPGFVQAWGELSRLGLASVAAPLQSAPEGQVADVNGLIRALREWGRGDLAQRFGWIIGVGYDDSRLREQRPLSRTDLDAVARDKPVLIVHATGHQVVLNSEALKLVGIDRDSVAPPAGTIGRWPGSKEPDGVLEGAAAAAVLGSLPKLPKDERMAMIQQGQSLLLQNGYTTAIEGRATPDDLALYTEAADVGVLKLDVAFYADLASSGNALKGHKSIGPKYYKNRLRLAGVSFALDGSAEDRSAWLTQAYQLPPPGKRTGFAGYPGATLEAATDLANRAYANGWQVAVQANGDAAIDQFLSALRAAAAAHPGKDRHPLLVGAQTIRDDQLDALKETSTSVSFASQRLALSKTALSTDLLGPERTARFAPTGSARQHGVLALLHADPTLAAGSPLGVMAAAIKRPVGDDQQLAPLDALKALTLLPARQLGEEKIKGSIAPGKLADLAVLSANPLKTPADKLGEIRVTGTIKEGATVFGGPEGGVPITH